MTNPATTDDPEEPTTIDNPKPTPVGVKHDDGKRRYDLLPPRAMGALADVLTYGAKKYGPWNWKLIESPATRYHAAALRHVMAWAMGERLDPESGLPHLAHAAASLMFVVELECERESHARTRAERDKYADARANWRPRREMPEGWSVNLDGTLLARGVGWTYEVSRPAALALAAYLDTEEV